MRVSRRSALRVLAAGATGAAIGGAAVGVHERLALGVTRATLEVTGLPPAFTGFRIAWLTDLHRSALVPSELVAGAVRLALDARPDLIALGGDYISEMDHRFIGSVAELLGPLAAPAGVLAVMGNHDDERPVAAAFAHRGIRSLREQRVRLTRGGDALDVVGIGYWTRRAAAIAALVERPAATVLLAHDPRRLTEAAALGVPLVLSGHTHGGQVVLPGIGPINRFRFPVVEGTKRVGRTLIFVSRGIGTIYLPIRINCPPEVAILTLVRREA